MVGWWGVGELGWWAGVWSDGRQGGGIPLLFDPSKPPPPQLTSLALSIDLVDRFNCVVDTHAGFPPYRILVPSSAGMMTTPDDRRRRTMCEEANDDDAPRCLPLLLSVGKEKNRIGEVSGWGCGARVGWESIESIHSTSKPARSNPHASLFPFGLLLAYDGRWAEPARPKAQAALQHTHPCLLGPSAPHT